MGGLSPPRVDVNNEFELPELARMRLGHMPSLTITVVFDAKMSFDEFFDRPEVATVWTRYASHRPDHEPRDRWERGLDLAMRHLSSDAIAGLCVGLS